MASGIEHILSPLSAPWCSWTMLVLLLCAILSEFLQPGVLTQASASLMTRANRTYKNAPVNFLGQALITIFHIGTLAMTLCLCFYEGGTFRFTAYLAVCGLIIAIVLTKMLCNVILDFVFSFSRQFGTPYEHYANIFTIAMLLLYPCTLLMLRIGNAAVCRWILGSAALLFLIMWIYRGARLFIVSPKAIVYFAMYISTLEVVPMGILYYLSGQTISQL